MKKWVSSLAMSGVLLVTFSIALASKPDSQAWTGWISDSGCAAKGMSADHKGCALKCVHDKGAKWVFVNSKSKKVSAIENQDAVTDDNVGMEVKVTGTASKDGTIHVDSIAPAGGM